MIDQNGQSATANEPGKGPASGQQKEALEVGIFKALLICLPGTILMELGHIHNHWLIGGALVFGVLLQALVPPRTKGLGRALAVAIVIAVLYGTVIP